MFGSSTFFKIPTSVCKESLLTSKLDLSIILTATVSLVFLLIASRTVEKVPLNTHKSLIKLTKKKRKNDTKNEEGEGYQTRDERKKDRRDNFNQNDDTIELPEAHDSDEDENEGEENDSRFVSMVTDEEMKLRSLFLKESEEEIKYKKQQSQVELDRENLLPLTIDEFEPLDFPNLLPYFTDWSGFEKQEKLDYSKKYFSGYINNIFEKYKKNVNYFECNLLVWLEVWKCLWYSDIICVIVDIRHPLVHFPPSLENIVTKVLKKQLILVLNKCDTVDDFHVREWKKYFSKYFSSTHLLFFSSFRSPKRRKRVVQKQNVYDLWKYCKEIYASTSKSSDEESENKDHYWDELLEVTKRRFQEGGGIPIESKNHKTPITIGIIGHPNTGKSTIINTLLMERVASTSMTPGKTKKSEHYYVSKNVRLYDSPGLVFPSINLSKELQILCGLFPISQVRVPYFVVKYLSERVLVEDQLKLILPREDFEVWSAWAICEAFAIKMNFKTKRGAGRNDVYRAANFILREVLNGDKVKFEFLPPGVQREDGKKKKRREQVVDKKQRKKKEDDDYFSELFD